MAAAPEVLDTYEDRVLSPEARELRARVRDAEAEHAYATTVLRLIADYEAGRGSPDAAHAQAVAELREEIRSLRNHIAGQIEGIADLDVTRAFDVAREACIDNPTPETFAAMQAAGRTAWSFFSDMLYDLRLACVDARAVGDEELAATLEAVARDAQTAVQDHFAKPYAAIWYSVHEAFHEVAAEEKK